ncbi:hypothetical protein MP228_010644 [Amoeboaphelidium protococcarum]|nr:hypothetical protein MP228_010644 [Amoeboaphelidium protococcarum]
MDHIMEVEQQQQQVQSEIVSAVTQDIRHNQISHLHEPKNMISRESFGQESGNSNNMLIQDDIHDKPKHKKSFLQKVFPFYRGSNPLDFSQSKTASHHDGVLHGQDSQFDYSSVRHKASAHLQVTGQEGQQQQQSASRIQKLPFHQADVDDHVEIISPRIRPFSVALSKNGYNNNHGNSKVQPQLKPQISADSMDLDAGPDDIKLAAVKSKKPALLKEVSQPAMLESTANVQSDLEYEKAKLDKSPVVSASASPVMRLQNKGSSPSLSPKAVAKDRPPVSSGKDIFQRGDSPLFIQKSTNYNNQIHGNGSSGHGQQGSMQQQSNQHLSPLSALKAQTTAGTQSSVGSCGSPETMAEKILSQYKFLKSFTNRYTVGDILGEGGFGFVVSALPNLQCVPEEMQSSVKEVAVKFIIKDKIPIRSYVYDPLLQTSVPFELFVLRRIDHPNIIKLVDWFEDAAFYYLVTEMHGSEWVAGRKVTKANSKSYIKKYKEKQHSGYMSDDSSASRKSERRASMDLFECIDVHQRFSEDLAKKVFKQVADAIYYLHHDLRIVHRDIKDENLVIDAEYNVKLIDFGAAAFIPQDVSRWFNTFHGTPQYCAPEIIKGQKYRGPEAEIWALGVLMYTMLFGENPFNDPKNAIDEHMSVRQLALGCGKPVFINQQCLIDPRQMHQRRYVPSPLNPKHDGIRNLSNTSSQRSMSPSLGHSPFFKSTNLAAGAHLSNKSEMANLSMQQMHLDEMHYRSKSPSLSLKQSKDEIRLSRVCVDLLDGMLCRNPRNRLTIEQIVRHPWFIDNIEGVIMEEDDS